MGAVRVCHRVAVWLVVLACLILSTQPDAVAASSELREVTPQKECRDIRHVRGQCTFFNDYCDDQDDGLLSYLGLYYCQLAGAKPVAIVIIIIWLVFLFTTLSLVAGEFFSVNLSVLSRSLHMSDSLAGVTLLALGNGSPDIFSTFAAVTSHSRSMAVGELVGAAAFITSVIAGLMGIIKPFPVFKASLIRDVLFLALATAFLLYVMTDGYLRLWHCAVMLGLYVVYVIVVASWHWWLSYRTTKDSDSETSDHSGARESLEPPTERTGLLSETEAQVNPVGVPNTKPTERRASNMSSPIVSSAVRDNRDQDLTKFGILSRISHLYASLFPTLQNLKDRSKLQIVKNVCIAPSILILKLTVPVPEDPEDDGEESIHSTTGWDRGLFIIQTFLAPQFVLFMVTQELIEQSSDLLVPAFSCLAGSVVVFILVLFTSTATEAPRWYRLVCVPGFVVSIVWISFVADEMVSVLKALGVICNVPESVLGMTVFAIGNSFDDLAANVSVARRGHPVMALSACFGGPLLNTLLGLGLTGLYALIQKTREHERVRIDLQVDRALFVTSGIVLVTLVIFVLLMLWTNWRMTRPVGYALIGVWVAGTVVNLILLNFT